MSRIYTLVSGEVVNALKRVLLVVALRVVGAEHTPVVPNLIRISYFGKFQKLVMAFQQEVEIK